MQFFFFNDTATTEIYTLSLHDALPISRLEPRHRHLGNAGDFHGGDFLPAERDRKSTRLNSSHQIISYAVFCLKKKKTYNNPRQRNDTSAHGKSVRRTKHEQTTNVHTHR